MRLISTSIIVFLFAYCTPTFSQSISISNTGNSPDQSAMLDIQSTDKGLLIPRMQNSQRMDINPIAEGLVVYDTDTKGFWYHDGIDWVELVAKNIGSLIDKEGDTQIQLEKNPNDNIIRFDIKGDEVMNIDSTGEVEIRSISIDAPGFLSLNNIDTSHFLRIFSGHQQSPNPFFAWEKETALQFITAENDYSDFVERMRISGNGNVGVGTTTPGAKLGVNGNVKITDGTQGAGKVLTSDADGLASWQTPTASVEVDPKVIVDSLNIVPRWDGNSLVNGTMIDNGTNVGIGVLNPSYKLQVSDDINVDGILIGKGLANNNSNLVVGFNAFKLNTIGLGNCAFGDQSLESSNANFNSGFGYRTLWKTTSGSNNTAMGNGALSKNITGSNNVGIGNAALERSLGFNNTGIGYNSLRRITDGTGNTALGYNTLDFNISGDYNTAVGFRAGENNKGSANIFLGNQAGMNDTTSNKLYIENSNSATPLIYGDFANDTVKVFGTLNIQDNYSFPSDDGSDGQILSTDGNGEISWEDKIAEVDPQVSSSTTNKVPKWNGTELVDGLITDNGLNVAIDTDARINGLTVGKGNDNIFSNTALGVQALLISSGNENTAIGYFSLRKNTTGFRNTTLGSATLSQNVSGNHNTAIGWNALTFSTGSRNTALGESTLESLVSGNDNLALGYRSIYLNDTGSRNTGIGNQAGNNNITGSGNVFIGYQAGFNELGSNTLYIDNSNTTDPLIYGDFDANSVTINGTIHISETAKLTPLATAPSCGTNEAGLLYFDDANKKLRVCDGTAWQDLH